MSSDFIADLACTRTGYPRGGRDAVGILNGCGNSYANKYTEEWLIHAKSVGAYHGAVIGNIIDLRYQWQLWLEENGLPEIPDPNKQHEARG